MAYIDSIVPFITTDELSPEVRSFQRIIALREHDTLYKCWESFCCQSIEDAEALQAERPGNWRIIDNRAHRAVKTLC
jgi:hypothetical protein